MKIQKVEYALGSNIFDIKKYLGKNYKRVLETTGIKRTYHASKKEDIISLALKASKKVLQNERNIDAIILISQTPKFFLEGIAFGGILVIILLTMHRTNNFISTLPVLSLYVYAGYRLMPALQQIYSSFSNIRFIEPSINKIFFEEIQIENSQQYKYENQLLLNKSLNLKNIQFYYPNSSKVSLKNINLSIQAKSTIGITGVTGSGKSTLVDILSGLLEAQKGSLIVDEKEISKENIRSWQNSIGYVPQNIFLFNDSIAANIAFTQNMSDINHQKVEEVSKIANLHDFVLNDLPEQYQTRVGERGVRLSGGQLQRIGIARALYKMPSLLILDEATSALDVHTEKSVMDSIDNMHQKLTIIIIAHRLHTLKNCEKIFLLEKGEIKKTGSYEEIISVYG